MKQGAVGIEKEIPIAFHVVHREPTALQSHYGLFDLPDLLGLKTRETHPGPE
jgi:hypothetical protein